MALLRLFRRFDGRVRGYMTLLAGELVLGFAAMARDDDYLAVVTVLLCLATVVIPWCLQVVARWLLARGHLAAFVRIIGVQATLMPGAGLSEDQKVLRGLLLMETRGVDTALQYLHELAESSEEAEEQGGELFVHEQIVTMLFYDMRWDEGIAHFERRFPLGYAVVHPRLALDLMRAYGEAGRFEHAANLLHILEEGLGSDPNSAMILSQARLTFLTYVGEAQVVHEAIGGGHGSDLGLSPARGALYQGIALARAGQHERAADVLTKVGSLAGPRDEREVQASRAVLGRAEAVPMDLGPEIQKYVKLVGERLRAFLQAERLPLRRGTMWGTISLVVAVTSGYILTQWLGDGGIGLLEVGAASSELWAAGSYGRVVTASFVQPDLISLMLSGYAIWLGGHVFERLGGSARLLVTGLVGGAAGNLGSVLLAAEPGHLFGGANAMAIAILVAALWSLMPSRTPGVQSAARRRLSLTLVLLMGAQLLACLPGSQGVVVTPVALLIACCIGILFAALQGGRWVAGLLRVFAVAGVVASGLAAAQVGREDVEGFALLHLERTIEAHGVKFQVPAGFAELSVDSADPIDLTGGGGWVDLHSRRAGGLVAGLVVPVGTVIETSKPGSSLPLAINPQLRYGLSIRQDPSLPPQAREILDTADGTWSTHTLQRNGEVVARVVMRTFSGRQVGLILAPANLLERVPRLYATLLAGAQIVTAPTE